MSSVVISGDTSGTVSLTVPAVAGTNTATLPAATGTVMVSGNMPAFSAYRSTSDQSVTNGAWTKLQAQTEEFDTSSAYDNATNYRYTPLTAGYYQVNGEILANGTSTLIRIIPAIYKNGSAFKYGNDYIMATGGQSVRASVSALIYMNGSTDYLELYANLNGSGTLTFSASTGLDNYFQAFMVRAA